jgi:hypothetical protein
MSFLPRGSLWSFWSSYLIRGVIGEGRTCPSGALAGIAHPRQGHIERRYRGVHAPENRAKGRQCERSSASSLRKMKGGKGKVHEPPRWRYLSCKMPRPNHLLIVCLSLVGLAVLVRTVAIGQRAYDVLLPPTSGDDWAPALAAVASGHTAEPLAMIDTEPLAPPVVNALLFEGTRPHVTAETPPSEGSPAKPEIPGQTASEKQKMGPTQAPRHHKGYSYRYYGFRPYWGPVVW